MKLAIRYLLCCSILAVPTLVDAEVVADSMADWSEDGTQGANGWTYGFYNATDDADSTYNPGDFEPFAGPDWVWSGTNWDEANTDGDNVPWTTIAQDSGHPNGDNNGAIHYAIRRWESNVSGEATIDFSLSKQNPNCGNGTTAIVFHNGSELGSITVASDDEAGLSESVMASLAAGDTVDLALSPLGTDGTFADGCDGSFYSMSVDVVPEPSSGVLLLSGLLLWPRKRRR